MILFKLLSAGQLEAMGGVLKVGKEASVYLGVGFDTDLHARIGLEGFGGQRVQVWDEADDGTIATDAVDGDADAGDADADAGDADADTAADDAEEDDDGTAASSFVGGGGPGRECPVLPPLRLASRRRPGPVCE